MPRASSAVNFSAPIRSSTTTRPYRETKIPAACSLDVPIAGSSCTVGALIPVVVLISTPSYWGSPVDERFFTKRKVTGWPRAETSRRLAHPYSSLKCVPRRPKCHLPLQATDSLSQPKRNPARRYCRVKGLLRLLGDLHSWPASRLHAPHSSP